MRNPIYKHTPGVCQLCGEVLSSRQTQFCCIAHKNMAQGQFTQQQIQKIRALCAANIKRYGSPRYKQVAKQMGSNEHTIRHHFKLKQQRRQRTEQENTAAQVAQAVSELKQIIAEAIAARETSPPYKNADILTGEITTHAL